MNLPDFLTMDPDGFIRFVGHRIGLHQCLYYYNAGYSPEMLVCQYPTLPLALIPQNDRVLSGEQGRGRRLRVGVHGGRTAATRRGQRRADAGRTAQTTRLHPVAHRIERNA